MTVIVHTEDDDLFLPSRNASFSHFDLATSISLATLSPSNSSDMPDEAIFHSYDDNVTADAEEVEGNKWKRSNRFFPPKNLSSTFLERLLTITPLDYRY